MFYINFKSVVEPGSKLLLYIYNEIKVFDCVNEYEEMYNNLSKD